LGRKPESSLPLYLEIWASANSHSRKLKLHLLLLDEVADQKEVVASLTFIRWCGLAAIVGGVASASLYVLGTLIYLYSPSSEEDIPPILNYMEPIYLLLLLVSALAAIAGVHALQRERYGLWGAAASLIAFIGVTLIFLGFLGTLVDLLAEQQRYRAVTGATDYALTVGVLAATVGILGLGLATIAVQMLPWWCGVLMVLGSPPAAFVLGPLIARFVGPLVGISWVGISWVGISWVGISWALVGYTLFRRAGDRLSPPDG